ncbi:hypothetical protein [Desulforamulus aeronauticus]|uniref:Uncharacterized protein n=1 Tax=Desulforamulus aeronauticus DSM 10349 TaxID=1121421 RepID=A0A1M6V3G0_9FIRM|nr:hypothetical protein [Desulforamulus aeronauticus]SHK75980.1 hypothetical protein SAMN02745123_03025 [Desulforamulus aeronauticus DSM 10349]
MELHFSVLSSFFSVKKKEKTQGHEKIERLKSQLEQEGYQPSEVEHFIKEALGSAKLSDLDAKELNGVIEKLKNQLELARKCKNLFK